MSASTERKLRQAAREAGTDKKTIALEKEAKEKAKSKRRWTAGTVAVIVCIVVLFVLNSNILYKSTAFTVGDKNYSASEVNYQYATRYQSFVQQYGSYASVFGLDTSNGIKGLAKQSSPFTESTWKDYFLDEAKTQMIQQKALNDYAAANGIALDADELAEVEAGFEGIDQIAVAYGYGNADKFFSANYGTGVNTEMVKKGTADATLASKVISQVSDSYTYTEDELEEHYKGYNGEKDYYDYAYYLVSADTTETVNDNGETTTEVSDEALAKAKDEATAIMTAYKKASGEGAVAKLNSVLSSGSAVEQESVIGTSLIAASDWLRQDGRKAGDITVEVNGSDTGYYVVVFLGKNDNHYKPASVRHILIKATAGDDGTYTDEAKAAAKAEAERILAEFKAGDKTEESFAALAEQYSMDEGSNTNGGLYSTVTKGQMVEEFDRFCFEGHKKGDTAIVYGESGAYAGYHVMYYVGEGEMLYSSSMAQDDLRNTALTEWLEGLVSTYTTSEGFGMHLVG